MKYLINFFIIILVTACADKTPELSRLSTDAVILAFGDSLTYGYGVKDEESYPAVLENLSGRKVINAGISGEVSGAGLNRLTDILEKYQPALLILCHGGNDLLQKKSVDQMESNIRQMIQLAADKDTPVILLAVPKPGLLLSPFEVYKKIAESTDAIFIEDVITEILKDQSLKSDNVHPNKEGYKLMAETIYSVLQEAGAL